MRRNISLRNLCKIGAIIFAVAGYISAVPANAQVGSSCTPAARGITTFSCGAPSNFVCGASPNFTCPAGAPATLGANQAYNCDSATCAPTCSSGFVSCSGSCVTSQAGNACITGAGRPGTLNACGTSCTESARPSVTLAPFSAQGDGQADASIWINKTGSGVLGRFQSGGTDRMVITNGGQLVLGLSSADWTTVTQTVATGQNLIYGVMTSTSTGNALLLEKQGTPNLSLLQLDASGNLTIGAQLRAPEICIAGVCRTTWPGGAGGLSTTAPATAGTLPKFIAGAGGALTLTNSLLSESSGTLTVGGAITATGCFGPVFVDTTTTELDGARGGYVEVHDLCTGTGAAGRTLVGSHTCSTDEILESIRCNSSPIFAASGSAWINNGPPAYLAQANDCSGWANNTDALGTIWTFSETGGAGFVRGCNVGTAFACCR